MKVKRKELSQYLRAFQELLNLKVGFNLAYTLVKNSRIVQQELNDLRKALAPSPKYLELEQKRMSLCVQSSLMGEDGQSLIVDNRFQIDPAKQDEFSNRMKELQNEYKVEIEDQQKKNEEFNRTWEETVDLDLNSIKKSYFPDEIIGNYVGILFDLIEEEKHI